MKTEKVGILFAKKNELGIIKRGIWSDDVDGILLIDKPASMTSFDVVYKVRKACGERSVGHTGTLDPQATGVLVLLLGKATKALPYLAKDKKEYVAGLKLGIRTETADIWGAVLEQRPVPEVSAAQLREVLNGFLGKSMQRPPMVSAIKKNGRKLYEYAREGIEIERESRPIEIDEIELLSSQPDIRFRAVCSAGTYVRSLCEDIAERLGTVGTMSSLVRMRAGGYSLKECQPLEEVLAGNWKLVSLKAGLQAVWPMIEVTEEMEKDIRNGKPLALDSTELTVALFRKESVLAMYERRTDGLYRCLRGLW